MQPQPVQPKIFKFSPWTLTSFVSHILSSKCGNPSVCSSIKANGDSTTSDHLCTHCKYERSLDLPSLPDMVFADNYLRIEHDMGFGVEFNALDALKLVDSKHFKMKVAGSKAWADARADSEHIQDVVKPYDWTYSTAYTGSIIGEKNLLEVKPTEERIDMEKLKAKEKILFYDEILLFEDELADNGCSLYSIKVRVMPRSFFVLARFYLRVDNVMIRINDTRLYYESGNDFMLREFTSRESPTEQLHVPPAILNDPNTVCHYLPLQEEIIEKLNFHS